MTIKTGFDTSHITWALLHRIADITEQDNNDRQLAEMPPSVKLAKTLGTITDALGQDFMLYTIKEMFKDRVLKTSSEDEMLKSIGASVKQDITYYGIVYHMGADSLAEELFGADIDSVIGALMQSDAIISIYNAHDASILLILPKMDGSDVVVLQLMDTINLVERVVELSRALAMQNASKMTH